MKTRLRQALAVAVLALGALVIPATAAAAPPANDDLTNAAVIDAAALPFNDSVTIDEATLEPGEPAGCYQAGKSIWYRITPTSNGVIRADVGSSSLIDRVLY